MGRGSDLLRLSYIESICHLLINTPLWDYSVNSFSTAGLVCHNLHMRSLYGDVHLSSTVKSHSLTLQ